MTPLTLPLAELLLAIATAEKRGVEALLLAAQRASFGAGQMDRDTLEDHRVAVAGDMADALDRIQPGLGQRWMQAMFPEVDYTISAEEAAADVLRMLGGATPDTPGNPNPNPGAVH